MISRLHIKNYKCLHDEDMEFRPLTVLTGTNSSGKSSVLQAVLLLARNCNPKNRDRMYDLISEYQELPCDASLTLDGTEYRYSTGSDSNSDADILRWEDSLYFLTANRIGPEKIVKMSKEYKVGENGDFLFGTFVRVGYSEWKYMAEGDAQKWELDTKSILRPYIFVSEKNRDLDIEVIYKFIYAENAIKEMLRVFPINENSFELEEMTEDLLIDSLPYLREADIKKSISLSSIHTLVNLWLARITEGKLYIDSEYQDTASAKIYFTHDGRDMISPFNLGSGMSYLAKVLILCFLAKPGDVVMIENPEIHLHPRAQSRLGEFFAFMAGKGIQLVIETHCEHLLSSLRYQVYKDRLRSDDVILYYKADDKTPFEQLRISKNGRYMNREGKQCGFPKGFFDVSVDQLLEIG